MADEAVIEQPIIEAPPVSAEPVETPAPDTETPESTETVPAAPPKSFILNGKDLSPEAASALAEVKAKYPELAAYMRHSMFHSERLQREFGGFDKLTEMREALEQAGGSDGLATLIEETNANRALDEQFIAGDPRAIEMMTRSPDLQQGFVSLMPAALQKYAQLHPDGFSHYVASAIVSDMSAAKIPLHLERLADFVGDNPKAQAALNAIANYVNGLGALSQKKIDNPKFAATGGQPADFSQREAELTRREWVSDNTEAQRNVYQAEWARLTKGRTLSDGQQKAVRDLFSIRLTEAIKPYEQKLNRYFASKDREGFRRLNQTINDTEIPKVLRGVFEEILPAKPGPKAAVPATNGTQRQGAPANPQSGFNMVVKAPASTEIDWRHSFNTGENYRSGKAILTDGRKVQWAR